MLHLYNTLSRRKEVFTPRKAGEVGMYVCGMTVYDYCHLGHARVMVVFDMVQQWLRQSGYQVRYVRNITDIDDKIIRRAKERGEAISALTERFIAAMHEDASALGVRLPDEEPRATRHIPQMLDMIQKLESKGLAYLATDGDVHYSVRDFPDYGQLSGRSLDEMRAGERVLINPHKHDPLDFVLWKKSEAGDAPDTVWDSPWGQGRPGWHIECSAMSTHLLGEHFDIHGGGADLQFPHHENEIAQSEGCTGHRFVNYWLHNGFVEIDNTKMSKSLGNTFTIRDILKQHDPEVVRFFILRSHYRSPLHYAEVHLKDAKQGLTRLYTALQVQPTLGEEAQNVVTPILENTPNSNDREDPLWQEPYARRFSDAMDDDFNTPVAVSILHELASEIHRLRATKQINLLRILCHSLGLSHRSPRDFLQGKAHHDFTEAEGIKIEHVVEEQIAQRQEARRQKDFARADQIRQSLYNQGIILEDKPNGQTEWRRA